jgi:hypothetical protein
MEWRRRELKVNRFTENTKEEGELQMMGGRLIRTTEWKQLWWGK